MITINPYLNFAGNTEKAFDFYRTVFGGEYLALMRYKDTFEAERTPDADKDKLMHVALPIGSTNVLMGTDMLESMGQKLIEGNHFSLSIGTDSEAEADKIFNALSAGGTIEMALEKTFWGAYFGMCKDKFGIQWMVNYDYEKK